MLLNVIVKEKLLLLHWEAVISEPFVSTVCIWRKEGVASEDAPSSIYHECGQKYSSKSHQLSVSSSPTTHSGTSNETIDSFMDNARGHGTNDATARYTGILWNPFNIEVVWQIPRSPKTNMLNLGIVTPVHHKRRCYHDALARSVVDAWNNYLSPDAFKNVFGRLRVVLSCIVEDGGDNSLVERKRGKLLRDATIVDLIADEDEYVSDDEDFVQNNEESYE